MYWRCLILAALTLLLAVQASGDSARFMCKDKSEIDVIKTCDGQKDCSDGSDDIFELCYAQDCKDKFQCNYGGCIDNSLICNGIENCLDGSDERMVLCANGTALKEFRVKLRGSCKGDYSLQCAAKDGNSMPPKCLMWSKVCDSVYDCPLGDDESPEICGGGLCGDGSWRCKNGACIAKDQLCDRHRDCADYSDELPAICMTLGVNREISIDEIQYDIPMSIAQWTPNTCLLHESPGSIVEDYFSQYTYLPGSELPEWTVIYLRCESGYGLFGNSHYICKENQWVKELSSCIRLCDQSPLVRDVRYSTQCFTDDDLVDCVNETSLYVGSQIVVSCNRGYTSDGKVGRHNCTKDGLWQEDQPNPICTPICGNIAPERPKIFPWSASLFERTKEGTYWFKCLATILSPYVVITSVSCFGDITSSPSALPYKIVEGDNRYEFEDNGDHGYVVHNLLNIHIVTHERATKIALISLVKPFEFGGSSVVQPVCLSFDSMQQKQSVLKKDNTPEGFGFTEVRGSVHFLTHIKSSGNERININAFKTPIEDELRKSENLL